MFHLIYKGIDDIMDINIKQIIKENLEPKQIILTEEVKNWIVDQINNSHQRKTTTTGYFDSLTFVTFKKSKDKIKVELTNGSEFAGYVYDVSYKDFITMVNTLDDNCEHRNDKVIAISHIVAISFDPDEDNYEISKRAIGFNRIDE